MQDPRTADFPLVAGPPYPVLAIMSFFLYFSLSLGPRLMANRAPLDYLKPLIIVYNFSMAVSNAYFAYLIIANCDYGRRFLVWHYPDQSDRSPRAMWELRMGWWYWMTKFLDLFDTVFFVLRKKFDHLSFLHLYHHTVVPIFGYLCLKFNPFMPVNGIFGLLNGLVHVVMYSYYGLSSLGPAVRPYLWWKRYITQMQLGQFAIFGLYGLLLVFKQTGYPQYLFWFGMTQPFFFFHLFYDFYKKTYQQRKLMSGGGGQQQQQQQQQRQQKKLN